MAIMIYLWFTVTSGVRETVKEKTTGSRKVRYEQGKYASEDRDSCHFGDISDNAQKRLVLTDESPVESRGNGRTIDKGFGLQFSDQYADHRKDQVVELAL